MKTPLFFLVILVISLLQLNAQTQTFTLSQTDFGCGVTSGIVGTFTSCTGFDAEHDLTLSSSSAIISNTSDIVNGQFTFDIEVNASTSLDFVIQSIISLVTNDPNNCIAISDTAETSITSSCIIPNDSCSFAIELFPGNDSCTLVSYDITGITNTHDGCMSDTTWLDIWYKATADANEWNHEAIPPSDTVRISVWDTCNGMQIGNCLVNGGITTGLTTGSEYYIKLAVRPGSTGTLQYCLWESSCSLPQIDTIPNVIECDSFTLAPISGTNLTGNEAYYTLSGGNGTMYLSGEVINSSTTLFAYDGITGCEDEDSFQITINPNPVANAGVDISICEGDSAQLQASGGISYNWTPIAGLSDPNISNPIAFPSASTTYTVTVVDGNGCQDTDDIIVTINPNPTPMISGISEICEGDSSILDAGSGYDSYLWNTGDTTQQITVSLAATYTITVIDTNGCMGSMSEVLTVNSSPTANAGADDEICMGDSVLLQATGGISYSWSPINDLSDPNIANPFASPSSSITYFVTVIDTAGCEDIDSVTITVFPLPIANAGADEEICEGDSIQLQASGGISYNWMPTTGISDPNISNPIAFPTLSTTYIATVTDTNGCVNADSLFITVNLNPSPTITGDLEICEGDSSILDAGSGYDSYIWSTGDTTQQIIVSLSDTYSITVTDASGCMGTTAEVLTVHSTPIANAGVDDEICMGDSVLLQATGGISYSWSPINDLSDPNIANPFASPSSSITYFVTVIDTAGCEDIDSVKITVFPLPIANAGADEEICEGDSIQLQASGGISYSWMPTTGISDPNISNPIAFPTLSTTYIATVADTNGCVNADSLLITVNSNPSPTITGDLQICEGDSSILDAGGGYDSYLWSNGDTSQQITVSLAGTYIVRVTDLNGCSGIATATVMVNPKPTANAGSDEGLCNGDSIQLQAFGGTSYTWTPTSGLSDPNIANPIAFPTSTVNYIVTVENTMGCEDTDTITITVFELPIANAGQDVEICQGDSIQLQASGGLSYNWSPNIGLSDPSISNPWAYPSGTTDYSVMVTDTSGCEDSDTMTITINNNPDPSITGIFEICSGDSTILDAGSGFSGYLWSTGESSQEITATETGVYSVTVYDGVGCMGSDSIDLTVYPAPIANAGNDENICFGDALQLQASGGEFYFWSPSTGLSNPNIANPIASPLISTTYSVTVTDTLGCMDTDDITIIVFSLPIANAGPDEEICDGDTVQLEASGGISYSWTPFFGLSNPNIANPLASPTETTIYTVAVTDTAGCSASDTLMISLNPNPNPVITGLLEICEGETSTLDAGSGYMAYNWSNGSTNQQITVSSEGTYSVTVTDINGCMGTVSEVFTVYPMPNANAGVDAEICLGSSVQLEASGGITYSWSPTNGLNDPNIANPTAEPTITTTYTVLVTDIFGCQANDDVTITVFPLPIANAGSDEEICQGETVQLQASGGVSYSWTPVFGLNNPNISNPLATPSVTTEYTVLVTDINGCESSDNLIVTVNNNPSPDITGINQLCEGESTIFDAGSGFITYNWSTGATTQQITLSTSGTYMVTVTNGDGCIGTDSKTLIIYPLPLADAGDDVAICEGESVQMQASGGINYIWSPTTGLSNPIISNPIASPTSTTTYSVTVTDMNGCENSDDATITVYPLPDVDAGPDQETCEGGEVQLQASGGIIYSWSPTTGLSNPNAANPLAFPTESTIYTVTVTDINGCEDSDEVSVIINPNPILEITGNTVLCSGESSTLDAGPGYVSYVWNTGETTQTIIVNNVGTYSVEVVDSLGCEAINETNVTVNTSLVPQITGDTSICPGEFTTLNAGTGFNSYQWNTGDTTQVIEVFAGGIYNVTVSNASGCNGSDEITVNAFSSPIINAGADVEICAGASIQLNASGGITYSWTPIDGLDNPSIPSPISSPSLTTLYTVTALDINGCDGSDQVLVSVFENPVADAGGNQMIPNGASTSLNGNATQGSGNYSYSWSPANLFNDPLVQNPTTLNLFTTQVFTLTVVDNISDCTDESEVTITVTGAGLSISISASPEEICIGDLSEITVTPSGGSGNYSYTWTSDPSGFTSNIQNPIVSPITTTTYIVTVDDGFNSAMQSLQIIVKPTPSVEIGADTTICYGDAYQICSNEVPMGDYLWSVGDTTPCIFADTEESATYILLVSIEDCVSSDTITITVADQIALLMGSSNESETGMDDGSAWVVVDGGSPPFSFLWSNGSMDSLITNLSPDTYEVTVTDQMGCQTTGSTVVNPGGCSGIEVFSTIIDVLCFEECSGRISIDSITGGTPPYSFNWSNGNINPFISGLCDTSYTVTITDNIQCQLIESYTIAEPDLLQIDIQPDSTFFMAGGTLPLLDTTYFIEDSWLYIEITDANGCTAIDSVIVVGVEDITHHIPIQVYPNPVRDVLFLDYPQEIGSLDQIELIDIYGRSKTILFDSDKKEIDVRDLPEGYYVLRVRKGKLFNIQRVVVVK